MFVLGKQILFKYWKCGTCTCSYSCHCFHNCPFLSSHFLNLMTIHTTINTFINFISLPNCDTVDLFNFVITIFYGLRKSCLLKNKIFNFILKSFALSEQIGEQSQLSPEVCGLAVCAKLRKISTNENSDSKVYHDPLFIVNFNLFYPCDQLSM